MYHYAMYDYLNITLFYIMYYIIVWWQYFRASHWFQNSSYFEVIIIYWQAYADMQHDYVKTNLYCKYTVVFDCFQLLTV
jgi:hypothetical protein